MNEGERKQDYGKVKIILPNPIQHVDFKLRDKRR